MSKSAEFGVVTGATSGIGKAIARRLLRDAYAIHALGRNVGELKKLSGDFPSSCVPHQIDLRDTGQIRSFGSGIDKEGIGLEFLIHAAGVHGLGSIATTRPEDLEELYEANVRAAYLLTQSLLPALERARGTIIFINSSAANNTVANVVAYSMAQHALRALANGLRAEVNHLGIRVLSIFLGRTATPRITKVFRAENRPFDPDKLLQPEDVADLILHVVRLPHRVEITELSVRPAEKSY